MNPKTENPRAERREPSAGSQAPGVERRAPGKIDQADCPKQIRKNNSLTWQKIVQILCTIHYIMVKTLDSANYG